MDKKKAIKGVFPSPPPGSADLLRGFIGKLVPVSRFLDRAAELEGLPGMEYSPNVILEHRFHLLELVLSLTLGNERGCSGGEEGGFSLVQEERKQKGELSRGGEGPRSDKR